MRKLRSGTRGWIHEFFFFFNLNNFFLYFFHTVSTRIEEKCSSSDGVIGARSSADANKFTSQSLPRKMTTKSFTIASEHVPPVLVEPSFGGHEDSKVSEKPVAEEPPPKPSRVPSFKVKPKKPPQMPLNERLYAEIDEADEDDTADLKTQPTDDAKTPTGAIEADNNLNNSEAVDPSSTPRHSRLSEMYQPSGSDSGNGSGDSVQTSASDARK